MPDTGWLIAGALLAVPIIWAVVNQHGVNRRRAHPSSDERYYDPAQATPAGFAPAPPDDDHDIDHWDLPDRTPGVHINHWTPTGRTPERGEW